MEKKSSQFNQDTSSGLVVMSFDFEMRWGVHDIYGLNIEGYRTNLENTRFAVASMLKLLAERDLRATWATVGALGMKDWGEYFSFAPSPPKYINKALSVRKEYADIDPDGKFHFAPDLITQILGTKGQELGSHSFSHLYFQEPGITEDDFISDMRAVEKIFKERFCVVPVSLVYPRNQSAFTESLDKTSIKIWRGQEPAWFYKCTTKSDNTVFPRFFRFIDGVNPWGSRVSQIAPKTVNASLFVRCNLPEQFWRLHLRRIENELSNLKPNHIFHLWWHPHNVGFDLKTGVARITQVFDLVAEACCLKGGVSSMNMSDCGKIFENIG